jgi:hypothetical protein
MKECVPDSPSTANPKRDAITSEIDLCQVSFRATLEQEILFNQQKKNLSKETAG